MISSSSLRLLRAASSARSACRIVLLSTLFALAACGDSRPSKSIATCEVDNGGCDALVTCTVVDGAVVCGDCPAGYAGGGAGGCVDVDECATGNGGCDALTVCTNTVGARTCGNCPLGYTGTGDGGCVDVDECATDHGDCDALTTCTNTPGSHTCGDCPTGYVGGGSSGCVDVDECENANGACDLLTTCTNTVGGRTCGACPTGYTGDGETGCDDVDECMTDNGGCDLVTVCTNTPGSFECGACPSGYTGDGASGCDDIDECAAVTSPCDPLTTCSNTIGSFDCSACPSGYGGTGKTACVDNDECMLMTDACVDTIAMCTNEVASYECACLQGFHGDGTTTGTGCSDAAEILHYRFDGTGTAVPNLATNPPAGTETAAIMGGDTQGGAGLCGGALVGTGNSANGDYLNTNWQTSLASPWTISFWTSDIAPSSTLFYIFGDINAGEFRCFTNGVAGPNNWILRGPFADVVAYGAATAAPHMTTFVYDWVTNDIRAYVDGVLVNTVPQNGVFITGIGPFKVGGYSTNVGLPAGGKLDEFRLYDRALSAQEVADLMVSASTCHSE